MTKAERTADRKSRGICIDCGDRPAMRLRIRCRRCARKASRSTQRWARRNREHAREVARHRMESLYWSNPQVFRAAIAARRVAKKANGMCLDCPRIALEDNLRCRICRDKDKARALKRSKRRARIEKREVKIYRPLDEVIDLTRVRVLRAARTLEWFSTYELNDELGYADNRQRNTLGQAVNRMARAGLLERRETCDAHGLRAMGSAYEYAITAAGLAELEAVLSGSRAPRHYTRRAA